MTTATANAQKPSGGIGNSEHAIPAQEQLKNLDHWVVWQYEERLNKKTGEMEPTKVLYWAQSPGRKASSSDASTWTSYQMAYETYARTPGRFDGIGFVFNSRIVTLMGIDLDHCVDEQGNIDAWAQDILRRVNSYAEFSPSGTGIHIFVEATLPLRGKSDAI